MASAEARASASAAANAETLDRESEVFARYLTGAGAGEYLQRKYREAHAGSAGGVVGAGTSAFDRALVKLARGGPLAARLMDAHARSFSAGGLLRRKLVLVLALLECSSPERVDAVNSRSAAGFFVRAAWLGASFAFLLLVSTVLLLPVRLGCALFGGASASSEAGEAGA